ncbi:alpha/beta hydrolase [Agrococcus terreus]|uniref:Esterase n=1 Tax=Agrococcus terreus TaxID=574649 RepID=A0ABQ2KP09_9MICO|nr:alpha/beta hydrolase [Agrococcus terreus]GGN88071.1 esterase [Agrococcus terreus]
MDAERIDPTLRSLLGGPRLDLSRRAVRIAGRIGPRLMRAPRVTGVRIRGGRLGGVRVRRYEPATRRSEARLLWAHGGGMVIGAPRMDDLLLGELAAELGIRVVSVDYRLAPEHPFPAPLDDLAAAWTGLVAEAAGAPVAIGGQSAGGGLAAALAQRVLAEGGPQPAAQLLLCPMLDDRTAADRSLDAVDHAVWRNSSNLLGWRALLGHEPGAERTAPFAVPARADDLAGLPPTWIGVGDVDLFHDEDVAYAERLRAAGVEAELVVVPGAPHGFETLVADAPLAVAQRAAARAWLAARLGLA